MVVKLVGSQSLLLARDHVSMFTEVTPPIKTAISIEGPLSDEVDALAQGLEISRSHLFVLAAREFVQRDKSQNVLEALNSAYDDLSYSDEQALQRQMRSRHRKLVKDHSVIY